MSSYSVAQQLKFELLAKGAVISGAARQVLRDLTHDGRLSPADYASTSGVIARLDGTESVNVPITDHNPNFVTVTPYVLDHQPDGFVVHGDGPGDARRSSGRLPGITAKLARTVVR